MCIVHIYNNKELKSFSSVRHVNNGKQKKYLKKKKKGDTKI